VQLSDYWCVLYSFSADGFQVLQLADYLTTTQRAFQAAEHCDFVPLSVHPTRAGASDECSVWQDRRNLSEIPRTERARQFRQIAEGLESEAF